MYIGDVAALEATCATLAGERVVAIDTEFMRERTYFARLCLIQIGTDRDAFVIDAIALEGELGRLAPLLESPETVKVFHAGSQDVEVLLKATGVTPRPLFDTQIAATLAGFPTQVGYAQLVHDLVGAEIDKADTFTDWSVRPLSDTQLAYAAADVEHLPKVYEILRERLEREGRLEWLEADFARLADPATYFADPAEQYRRVKRASSLDRRSLAVLREVAAWRETEVQRRDVPRRWLVSDESLIEVARRRPADAAALAGIRGVGDRAAGKMATGILRAIADGMAVPEEDLPRLPKRSRVPTDAQPVADVLSAVCRIRAREHGVALTLLATRDELERFAAGEREGHPLAEGWRRTLVGAELEALLDGRSSLSIHDGRIVLSEVSEERADAAD
ncbi:MAG: ribonuclease D [Coriobacteriia bacterium]|nr:ribonuclease D [Coriobacteriia bacterium]